MKDGTLLIMLLCGGVSATGANLYLRGTLASCTVNYGCVAIFVLLTAYDRDRLKWLFISIGDSVRRAGLLGALLLYLDLLNIIFLLVQGSEHKHD